MILPPHHDPAALTVILPPHRDPAALSEGGEIYESASNGGEICRRQQISLLRRGQIPGYLPISRSEPAFEAAFLSEPVATLRNAGKSVSDEAGAADIGCHSNRVSLEPGAARIPGVRNARRPITNEADVVHPSPVSLQVLQVLQVVR